MGEITKNQTIAHQFVELPETRERLLYVHSLDSFFWRNEKTLYYALLSSFDLEKKILDFAEIASNKSLGSAMVGDIIWLSKHYTAQQLSDIDTPYLALTDCLYNTDTFKTIPFSQNLFAFSSLNFPAKVLTNAVCPLWHKFLKEILIKEDGIADTELIAVVQEMFGYCLLNTVASEASFFLVGDGSNGKSVLLSVLRELIGSDNVSSSSLEVLSSDQFAASELVGKKLNICTEDESTHIRPDKFKALVSGEAVRIERKFKNAFSAKLFTRFIFSSQELPNFSGFNHGLMRRVKIIPFNKTIADKDRVINLFQTFLPEMAGIASWALEGAKRLVSNHLNFSFSTAMNEKKSEFADAVSSAIQFVKENYEESPDSFVPNTELYKIYVDWCKDNGRKPFGGNSFKTHLRRFLTLPSIVRYDLNEGRALRGRSLKYRVEPPPLDLLPL